MRRWYTIHGTIVSVEADDEELGRIVTCYMLPFEREKSLSVDFTIQIRRAQPEKQSAYGQSGPLTEIAPNLKGYLYLNEEDTFCSVPEAFSAVASRKNRSCMINISATCPRGTGALAGIHSVERMLSYTDRHLFHGAAFLFPDDSNRAFLLFGKSGMGKSTTSLALAGDGYRLLTDDAIVLEKKIGTQHYIWGLPRPIKVHRNTVEMLPFLKSVVTENWNDEEEQSIHLDHLKKIIDVGDQKAYEVAAVALLAPRNSEPHELKVIPKAEAVVTAAIDNLHSTRDVAGCIEIEKRFQALSSLFSEYPTLSLKVGKDIDRLGYYMMRQFNKIMRQ